MATRSGMEEVELVEHDTVAAEPVDHVERARGAVRERARGVLGWLGRHRVLAAVTAAAVALAIAVPAGLSARSDRARTEALSGLPGVLSPMASAPEVVWTTPASSAMFSLMVGEHAWVRDDALVLWEQTGDSTSSLRAVDVRTGDELWTSPLSSIPDLGDPENRSTDDPTTCSAPAAAPGEGVVVCVVPDAWQLTPPVDDAGPARVEPVSVRLRAFDAMTGETVLDQPLGKRASLAPLGADVVVATVPDSGTGPAHVRRLDPATGDGWSAEIPRPLDGAGMAYPTVQVFGDEIAVGWLGTTALFSGIGETTGRLDADNVWNLREHRLTPQGDGFSQLRDLDTGRVVLLGDARPAWIATDDGSAPDLLMLSTADALTGRSLTTGFRAWQLDWPMESTLNLVVVDGLLARQAADRLTVVDAETGEQLWQRTRSAYGQSMVTDGRRLLVLESVVGTGPVVAAYDARDGRRVWEAPVPVSVQYLAVVDHRLFAFGSEGVVAFSAN